MTLQTYYKPDLSIEAEKEIYWRKKELYSKIKINRKAKTLSSHINEYYGEKSTSGVCDTSRLFDISKDTQTGSKEFTIDFPEDGFLDEENENTHLNLMQGLNLISTPNISESEVIHDQMSESPLKKSNTEDSEFSLDESSKELTNSPVAKDLKIPFAMLNNFGAIKEVSDEEDNTSTESFNHEKLPKNTQSSPLKHKRFRFNQKSKKNDKSKRDKERRKYADPVSIKPAFVDLYKEK